MVAHVSHPILFRKKVESKPFTWIESTQIVVVITGSFASLKLNFSKVFMIDQDWELQQTGIKKRNNSGNRFIFL